MIDAGLAAASKLDFDTRRGIFWYEKARIAEWVQDGGHGRVALCQHRLSEVGISVQVKLLDDAVQEVVSSQ